MVKYISLTWCNDAAGEIDAIEDDGVLDHIGQIDRKHIVLLEAAVSKPGSRPLNL